MIIKVGRVGMRSVSNETKKSLLPHRGKTEGVKSYPILRAFASLREKNKLSLMKAYHDPSDTTDQSLKRLQHLVDTIPEILKNIPESEFAEKPVPDKWSKKEIIGHLIDSATNNHHRFVRAQFEIYSQILYDQNQWNNASHYQEMDSKHLISFWESYNRHLIELIKLLSPDQLTKESLMSDGKPYSIAWIFRDYVGHIEHHLKQILDFGF
jgi:iron-sulfur cluster repair protein YtfE (RIC family)